jgi:hypothetical protein
MDGRKGIGQSRKEKRRLEEGKGEDWCLFCGEEYLFLVLVLVVLVLFFFFRIIADQLVFVGRFLGGHICRCEERIDSLEAVHISLDFALVEANSSSAKRTK